MLRKMLGKSIVWLKHYLALIVFIVWAVICGGIWVPTSLSISNGREYSGTNLVINVSQWGRRCLQINSESVMIKADSQNFFLLRSSDGKIIQGIALTENNFVADSQKISGGKLILIEGSAKITISSEKSITVIKKPVTPPLVWIGMFFAVLIGWFVGICFLFSLLPASD